MSTAISPILKKHFNEMGKELRELGFESLVSVVADIYPEPNQYLVRIEIKKSKGGKVKHER